MTTPANAMRRGELLVDTHGSREAMPWDEPLSRANDEREKRRGESDTTEKELKCEAGSTEGEVYDWNGRKG
jgi:hypothetical protein